MDNRHKKNRVAVGNKLGLTVFIFAFVSGIIGLGVVIGSTVGSDPDGRTFAWALASLIFGALVGLSEILSRYRDEPLRAATTIITLALPTSF